MSTDNPAGRRASEASRSARKNADNLSKLPLNLRAKVLAFRRELIAEREEQERMLREALDHFKREVEIENAVLRRLMEVFKHVRQSERDGRAHTTR